MDELKNKIAVITGASKGIGRAIAEAYAKEGAIVYCVSRTNSDLENVVDSIKSKGGKAIAFKADVTKYDQFVTTLRSQKRLYTVRDMPMTEAGIDAGFTRDIYISLGEPLDDEAWSIRLYHKPFVRWIWLGAILMATGGLLAIIDRRYRLDKLLKKSSSSNNEAIPSIK